VTEGPYDVVVAPSAARAISERLPEAVAAAVIDFITGPLLDNPQRLGRELKGDLAGLHSARRGTFRILYRIDDAHRTVSVQRIEHRGNAYRPR
jgi:mRNA-degrading endonuclease RelE of RelBE toxin-antitoxin system